jgi:putative ABC transport system permease protein
MFLRLITDNFTRRPRRKLLTAAALSLGMAVATAALSVSLDVGDRLSQEFRSLGANLVATPEADSLPLEIGGVDIRPANSGAYLPEADLPKIKSVFWRNNIIAFAPILEDKAKVLVEIPATEAEKKRDYAERHQATDDSVPITGTWIEHPIALSDGSTFTTGADKTNPWWAVDGRWFREGADECVVGKTLAQSLNLRAGDRIYLGGSGQRVQLRSQLPSFLITGILSTGGVEENSIVLPLKIVQELSERAGQYRKLYISALTKPEDDFARRDPKTMKPDELEKWSCSPYVSSIAYSIKQVLPDSHVRVIRRVADGEGKILTRVRTLLWLVTFASLLAAALAVGASSAASVIERRTEIGLMKALGAGSGTVGFLLAAEQLLLAFVGGCIGYSLGLVLARFLGTRIFGVPPEPSLLVLGVILVLAAAVTLLGSALPLRRAARFDPAPILRGE